MTFYGWHAHAQGVTPPVTGALECDGCGRALSWLAALTGRCSWCSFVLPPLALRQLRQYAETAYGGPEISSGLRFPPPEEQRAGCDGMTQPGEPVRWSWTAMRQAQLATAIALVALGLALAVLGFQLTGVPCGFDVP